jgi:hypothetical protein
MRLTPSVWQTSWYEEGLSERFVQEVARLEKTVIKDLGTSAQWVEQIVIELGQLTQNMIHLEGEGPRTHQLKLALERALKLAALSAHLMVALDKAMDHGPAVLRYSEGSAPDSGDSIAARMHSTSASLPPGYGTVEPAIPSHPPAPMPSMQVAPAQGAQAAAAPAQAAATPGLRASPQVQVGLKRQSSPAPRPGSSPAAAEARDSRPLGQLVQSLMESSEPMVGSNSSPVREMILALSRRGLSRSEIEVITEQPRHIIESVLQQG